MWLLLFASAGQVAFQAFAGDLDTTKRRVIDTSDGDLVKLSCPKIENGLDLYIKGRHVTLAPGVCWIEDKKIEVLDNSSVEISPSKRELIVDEPVVLSDEKLQGQLSKTILKQCRACLSDPVAIDGVLVAGSLMVRSSRAKDAVVYKQGIDYLLDERWGAIGRAATGAIKKGQTVYVSYQIWLGRLDTLILDGQARLKIIEGNPSRTAPITPCVPQLSLPLANIYIAPGVQEIVSSAILPIAGLEEPSCPLKQTALNRQALAKTISKLQSRVPTRIVFWGDSITGGADASSISSGFPPVFISKLKARFPNSCPEVINLGVGGTNTKTRLPGFESDVLALKPDVVIVEFVNDLRLPIAELEENYRKLISLAKKAGVEVILVAPHFPNPTLLGVKNWDSVRQMPYMTMLKRMATESSVAFADVAFRWQHLDRQGLRPDLMLVDRMIHPNDVGHEIYAEELMKCF